MYNPFSIWDEVGFDGTLNYNTGYYYDEDIFFVIVTIYGKYKSCNYSSEELDYLVLPPTTSAAVINNLKNKSRNSEALHKLLDEKPSLKKRYLEIKAKLVI